MCIFNCGLELGLEVGVSQAAEVREESKNKFNHN